ncbi:MAG TPA: hypothetical protein VF572_07075 [Candidatus Saccharimonadales bacterium]
MKRNKQGNSISTWLRNRGVQPMARAIMVVSAVAVLATGVTYAALQSQAATLTGNTISTATADLKIGSSASTFSATRAGFNFSNIIPGATPSPTDGNSFYLKNFGAAPMALKVAVSSTPANTANVDLTKVFLVFTRVDTTATQKLSLASLVSAHTTGGTAITDSLAGGAVAQFKTQVTMDDDAFTGTTATVGGIDLTFNGTVVAQ